MKSVDDIFAFCTEKNIQLLFLVKCGSFLYGTNNENSDTDYKGIFLPNKRDLLLNNIPSFSFFTTGDTKTKNNSNDVDIQLYSLHNFLDLVRKGDTGAIDLLFAYTNQDATIYTDQKFSENVLKNIHHLFNVTDTKAFVGYAIGQAAKYGIKGTRFNIVKQIYNFLDTLYFEENDLLKKYIDTVINICDDQKYCYKMGALDANKQEINALNILGTIHLENIKLMEFKNRMIALYNKYGNRTHNAAEKNGTDYKALSHAIRSLFEIQELIHTGKIIFPLQKADIIKNIKNGHVEFDIIQQIICEELNKVDNLVVDIKNGKIKELSKFNINIYENIILSFYT